MKVPVAFALWQILRLNCIRLYDLATAAEDDNSAESRELRRLEENFNLLLAIHKALYRSFYCSPLLCNFTQGSNGDLLGGNADLIEAGMKLGQAIREFRDGTQRVQGESESGTDILERLRLVLGGQREL